MRRLALLLAGVAVLCLAAEFPWRHSPTESLKTSLGSSLSTAPGEHGEFSCPSNADFCRFYSAEDPEGSCGDLGWDSSSPTPPSSQTFCEDQVFDGVDNSTRRVDETDQVNGLDSDTYTFWADLTFVAADEGNTQEAVTLLDGATTVCGVSANSTAGTSATVYATTDGATFESTGYSMLPDETVRVTGTYDPTDGGCTVKLDSPNSNVRAGYLGSATETVNGTIGAAVDELQVNNFVGRTNMRLKNLAACVGECGVTWCDSQPTNIYCEDFDEFAGATSSDRLDSVGLISLYPYGGGAGMDVGNLAGYVPFAGRGALSMDANPHYASEHSLPDGPLLGVTEDGMLRYRFAFRLETIDALVTEIQDIAGLWDDAGSESAACRLSYFATSTEPILAVGGSVFHDSALRVTEPTNTLSAATDYYGELVLDDSGPRPWCGLRVDDAADFSSPLTELAIFGDAFRPLHAPESAYVMNLDSLADTGPCCSWSNDASTNTFDNLLVEDWAISDFCSTSKDAGYHFCWDGEMPAGWTVSDCQMHGLLKDIGYVYPTNPDTCTYTTDPLGGAYSFAVDAADTGYAIIDTDCGDVCTIDFVVRQDSDTGNTINWFESWTDAFASGCGFRRVTATDQLQLHHNNSGHTDVGTMTAGSNYAVRLVVDQDADTCTAYLDPWTGEATTEFGAGAGGEATVSPGTVNAPDQIWLGRQTGGSDEVVLDNIRIKSDRFCALLDYSDDTGWDGCWDGEEHSITSCTETGLAIYGTPEDPDSCRATTGAIDGTYSINMNYGAGTGSGDYFWALTSHSESVDPTEAIRIRGIIEFAASGTYGFDTFGTYELNQAAFLASCGIQTASGDIVLTHAGAASETVLASYTINQSYLFELDIDPGASGSCTLRLDTFNGSNYGDWGTGLAGEATTTPVGGVNSPFGWWVGDLGADIWIDNVHWTDNRDTARYLSEVIDGGGGAGPADTTFPFVLGTDELSYMEEATEWLLAYYLH